MDAAHVTDMIRRNSVTGLLFMLAGGVIAYKSKLQVSVATSSTEAELYAAVDAANIAHLAYTTWGNSDVPHPGEACQECNQAGLHSNRDQINVADNLTKGLGWTLHVRHVGRVMGPHRPTYAAATDSVPCTE
jgi:hypothetical protein